MENMNQLRGLLKHEIKDLYSAEEQIIDALPKMIEKANDKNLKKALQDHLQVTRKQKGRLDDALEALDEERKEEGESVFGLFKGEQKCLAMEGLISEGEKLMKEDMSADVSDAAIIAAAQKIEHYEISSYGTARAYAQELNLDKVEELLRQTLDEEYEADNLLSQLAESRVNQHASTESGSSRQRGRLGIRGASSDGRSSRSRSSATAKASSSRRSSSTSSRTGGSPSGRSSASSRSKNSSGRSKSNGRGRSSR